MKLLLILSFFIISSCGNGHLFHALDSQGGSKNLFGLSNSSVDWTDSRYKFRLDFINGTKVGVNSPFTIKFWDSYQHNSLGPFYHLSEKLCVFLWMKMPSGVEHGSSPVVVSKTNDSYKIEDVYFIMPGEWRVYIRSISDGVGCTKTSPFLKEAIVKVYL